MPARSKAARSKTAQSKTSQSKKRKPSSSGRGSREVSSTAESAGDPLRDGFEELRVHVGEQFEELRAQVHEECQQLCGEIDELRTEAGR
jgi:hypothetical protein